MFISSEINKGILFYIPDWILAKMEAIPITNSSLWTNKEWWTQIKWWMVTVTWLTISWTLSKTWPMIQDRTQSTSQVLDYKWPKQAHLSISIVESESFLQISSLTASNLRILRKMNSKTISFWWHLISKIKGVVLHLKVL